MALSVVIGVDGHAGEFVGVLAVVEEGAGGDDLVVDGEGKDVAAFVDDFRGVGGEGVVDGFELEVGADPLLVEADEVGEVVVFVFVDVHGGLSSLLVCASRVRLICEGG